MLEMFLYAIGIMFTPGPMNLLGLNLGINKKLKETLGFYFGVGAVMLLLFLIFGYSGERFIKKDYLLYISVIGTFYIARLSYKIFKSSTDINEDKNVNLVGFKDGFFMHLFNPKATLATLPIATINFPTNEIVGIKILIMSLILGALATLAPLSYSLVGYFSSSFIKKKGVIKIFNTLMAIMLMYVALSIFYDHVYLVLKGVKPY